MLSCRPVGMNESVRSVGVTRVEGNLRQQRSDKVAVERALEGIEPVIPRRRTFYGMDEVCVREPGGRVVVFAQPVAA